VYLTSPLWGHIVDVHGPRRLLASGFFLLLAGYSGIRFIFDTGIPPGASTISTPTFCALVACKLMTGAGGNCGIMSALNTSAKTFPDRAVRYGPGFFWPMLFFFFFFFCGTYIVMLSAD
jgi:hypothetical protein